MPIFRPPTTFISRAANEIIITEYSVNVRLIFFFFFFFFFANNVISQLNSGAPGLVNRVFAVHTGSREFDSHRRHMSERFF